MATPRLCSIPDCDNPHYAQGWCVPHYKRWRRYGDPLGGSTHLGDPERFYQEIVLTYEGNECLIWPFGRSKGYARCHSQLLHRRLCEDVNGPPPTPKHEAAHSCGKGHEACVTKRHLSWKTHAENDADKLTHGTRYRGERCSHAKLTETDVRQIRSLSGTMSLATLSKRFGVGRSSICNIIKRRKWAWLD